MPKLTKRIVDSAAPGETDVIVWCGVLAGFGLRVKPSGVKSYILQYRNADGRSRRITLGRHGPVTTEQAREKALTLLGQVTGGADPAQAKADQRAAPTVADIADAYLAAAQSGAVLTRFRRPKKASTVAIDVGRVERHIKPLIGHLKAHRLTRAQVQRMADSITAGKTATTVKTKARGKAVVTGGSGTAARVVELLGGIWTWAERRGMVSGSNPAHGVETERGSPKDRVLTETELMALGVVLARHEPDRPQAVACLRLIALSGLRRAEAMALRWDEVDNAGRCLRLTDTKTGRSMRPLGSPALDLLSNLPRRNGVPFAFPNVAGTGPSDLKKQMAAILDEAGLADARSHDLRRTFASTAADMGYGDATIAELLGHARRGVTERHYVRRADEVLLAAADRVAERIADAMGLIPAVEPEPEPAEPAPPVAQVIPLPTRLHG